MKQKLNKQDKGFTMIKNEILLDKEVSLRGKGLYCYLFSKPADWDFAYNRIAAELGVGQTIILNGLKELEDKGYLKRDRQLGGKMNYFVYADKTSSESHNLTKELTVKTDPISNTNNTSNTEDPSNTNTNTNTTSQSKSGSPKPKEKAVLKNPYADISSLLVYFYSKLVPAETSARRFVKSNQEAMDMLITTYTKEDIRNTIDVAETNLRSGVYPKVTTPVQFLNHYKELNSKLLSNQVKRIRI